MTRILFNLTVLHLLTMLAAFVVGWLSFFRGSRFVQEDPTYIVHVFLGLVSVSAALGVHCLVFIYFLGTGRWVKEVALAYGISDEPLPKQTRELKRKAYPLALFAMLVPIAASAAGAGVATMQWSWYYHASLAVAALAVNFWAFAVEYECVRVNATVIDAVLVEVDRIRAERGLPSNAEALQESNMQS